METKILYGAPVAAAQHALTERLLNHALGRGVVPALAILRMGGNAEAAAYAQRLNKKAISVGIRCEETVFPPETPGDKIADSIRRYSEDEKVHGILLMQPLSKDLDARILADKIPVSKDVDGASACSAAALYAGRKTGFAPCTADACITLLKHYGYKIAGKRVTVVGRSLVVGRPVAMLLLMENATVTVCHSKTENLASLVHDSDIVICAAGKASLVDKSCIREGQVIIDAGINILPNGSFCGDADFAAANGIVEAITPVPGGIGAVTTSLLLRNVALSACGQETLDEAAQKTIE